LGHRTGSIRGRHRWSRSGSNTGRDAIGLLFERRGVPAKWSWGNLTRRSEIRAPAPWTSNDRLRSTLRVARSRPRPKSRLVIHLIWSVRRPHRNVQSIPPVCRAKLSSIILSKMVRARTNVSFIVTKSAAEADQQNGRFAYVGNIPRFWLYLSISLTILGRRAIHERYSS